MAQVFQNFRITNVLSLALNPRMAHTEAHNSLKPIVSLQGVSFLCKLNPSLWIFDCGATYTMTFYSSDLLSNIHTNRTLQMESVLMLLK